MTRTEYLHLKTVRALAKPGAAIIEEMTPDQAHALHMIIGVAGEVGEALDAIKKWVIYRRPLDVTHLVEELGDIEFYLAGLRDRLKISRDDILQHNIAKLKTRYPGGSYSNADAQSRADKQ